MKKFITIALLVLGIAVQGAAAGGIADNSSAMTFEDGQVLFGQFFNMGDGLGAIVFNLISYHDTAEASFKLTPTDDEASEAGNISVNDTLDNTTNTTEMIAGPAIVPANEANATQDIQSEAELNDTPVIDVEPAIEPEINESRVEINNSTEMILPVTAEVNQTEANNSSVNAESETVGETANNITENETITDPSGVDEALENTETANETNNVTENETTVTVEASEIKETPEVVRQSTINNADNSDTDKQANEASARPTVNIGHGKIPVSQAIQIGNGRGVVTRDAYANSQNIGNGIRNEMTETAASTSTGGASNSAADTASALMGGVTSNFV